MSQVQEATNWEVFLWALYRLGGATEFIEVEDIFLKCFQLAPNRFSWRTRENLPDYKKCSKALRDAEAKQPHFLVKTGDGFKRQLTVEGQKWIEAQPLAIRKALATTQAFTFPLQAASSIASTDYIPIQRWCVVGYPTTSEWLDEDAESHRSRLVPW